MSYSAKRIVIKTVCYVFLGILFLICVVPIYMVFVNATRHTDDIAQSLSLIPGAYTAFNFTTLVDRAGINVVRGTFNSLFIAFTSTFLAVYFSLLTAYAINIYNFRFKKQLWVLILGMTMVPGQLFILGFFQHMHGMGMLDSFVPLILPSISSAAMVFFAKQYLDASLLPELVQAARIDGAGELSIFNRIILPLAKPGAFTMAIFVFVGSWNNFMTPFFLISPSNTEMHTLPLIVNSLNTNAFRRDFGLFYLGMAISIVPIIAVYAAFSKHIVSGISLGSVKE